MSDTASYTSDHSEHSVETVLSAVKEMEFEDLMKVMKIVCAELDKKTKSGSKTAKAVKVKNATGGIPRQLRKNNEWVDFVQNHAVENGWESFAAKNTKKDKTVEVIEMPASIMYEGAHVYEDSVTDDLPHGRQLTHKEAMSLSKHYWAAKEQVGSRHDLYQEFLDQFEENSDVAAVAAVAEKPAVIHKTAAEKAAEKETAKKVKAAEKEAKKAAKAAAKADKDAIKEAEKAEKKAEKEAAKAEKEAEKAAKSAPKKVAPKAPIKAAPVKAAAKVALSIMEVDIEAAEPVVLAPAVKKLVPKSAASLIKVAPKAPAVAIVLKEQWTCPNDGEVHPWTFKGKKYYRNYSNELWEVEEDNSAGDWVGMYIHSESRIDDSVANPYDDEE